MEVQYKWMTCDNRESSRIHLHNNGSFEIMDNELGNGFFGVSRPIILFKLAKNNHIGKLDSNSYYYSLNLNGKDSSVSNCAYRSPRNYYKILATSDPKLSEDSNITLMSREDLLIFANEYNSKLLITNTSTLIPKSDYIKSKNLENKLLEDLKKVREKIKTYEDDQKSLLFFPEIIDNLTIGPFKLGGPCKFIREAIDKFGSAIPEINSSEQKIKSITHRDQLYSIVELYSGVKISINWIEPI